jgi:Arc/MetJ-type ribon-helix-helix transcriptional regulator
MRQKKTHGGKRAGAGRPATGKDPVRTMRLSDEFIASVDEWAASYEQEFMTRSEAIRRLVEIGLKKTKKAQ